jgi:hypothetical protein
MYAALAKLAFNLSEHELLFNLGAYAVHKDNSHAHCVEHGDIFDQVLKANFLNQFTSKGNNKGLFAKAMNVRRNVA